MEAEEITQSIDTETGKPAAAELSSERVSAIFSQIAHKYERFNAVSSFGTYKRWLSDMVAWADVLPEHTVLDIAGGTGDVTFAVAEAKTPAHIQCTDLVPEMLEVAAAHVKEGRGANVSIDFEVVDAQDIPYESNSFDVVTVAYGLRNMPQRVRALREMNRVLKPGGELICLDFSTPKNAVWKVLYRFYLNVMIPFWGKLITGDASGFIYLAKSIKAFPDQEGVAGLMEEAGFEHIEWRNCTGGIACIHKARKPA